MIEFNTIATGCGSLWQRITEIQGYIEDKYGHYFKHNYPDFNFAEDDHEMKKLRMHQEGYDHRIDFSAKCAKALDTYNEIMGGQRNRTNTWVLFVIENIEKNVGDQKLVESSLYFDHGKIKSKRLTLQQVSEYGHMDEKTGVLTIQGAEIGFVYYRSGYAEH